MQMDHLQDHPVNIELNGEDYEELIFTAERMRDYLNTKSISGVDELKIDVNKSKPGNAGFGRS